MTTTVLPMSRDRIPGSGPGHCQKKSRPGGTDVLLVKTLEHPISAGRNGEVVQVVPGSK